MSIPFPQGLSIAEKRLPDGYVGLFYGVNAGFGTVGVAASVLLTVYFGFTATFYLGVALYGLAFAYLVSQTIFASPNRQGLPLPVDTSPE